MSTTANMPPHPLNWVLARIGDEGMHCGRTQEKDAPTKRVAISPAIMTYETKEVDTHFAVKLLITPVVVLYCSASRKMAAIPARRGYKGKKIAKH